MLRRSASVSPYAGRVSHCTCSRESKNVTEWVWKITSDNYENIDALCLLRVLFQVVSGSTCSRSFDNRNRAQVLSLYARAECKMHMPAFVLAYATGGK